MLKKLFFFLLKKYSKTEKQRLLIYKELFYQVEKTYPEQTVYGNVYNANVEFLMSNPFVISRVRINDTEGLQMLKSGLQNSFDESISYIYNEKIS
jgi:hypothetical protein